MKPRTYPIALEASTRLRSWRAVATNEFRKPKRGEWYLTDHREAKRAPCDLLSSYHIAVLVPPHAPVEANRLNLTLNVVLTVLGMTIVRNHSDYRREIRDPANSVTFIGDANETWQWLRDTGRIC